MGVHSPAGEAITYIKLNNVDKYKYINPQLISSATVHLSQQVGREHTYSIGVYDSNTSVSIPNATYNNISANVGTLLDTVVCSANKDYGWQITNVFQAWLGYELSGNAWSAYQFMMKAVTKGQGFKQFLCAGNYLWFQVDYSVDTSLDYKTYKIRNVYSGKYLDMTSPPYHGAPINQWTYHGDPNQIWEICSQMNGRYKLYAWWGTRYSYAMGANGTSAKIYTGSDGDNLQFHIVSNNDGTYRIISNHTGSPVALGATSGNSGPLVLGNYTGDTKQKWVFERTTLRVNIRNYFDRGLYTRWRLNQNTVKGQLATLVRYAEDFYNDYFSITVTFPEAALYTTSADVYDGGNDIDQLNILCSHSPNHNMTKDIHNTFANSVSHPWKSIPILWTGHWTSERQSNGTYKTIQDGAYTQFSGNDTVGPWIFMLNIGGNSSINSTLSSNARVRQTVLHELAHCFGAKDTYCLEDGGNDNCSNPYCTRHYKNTGYEEKCIMTGQDNLRLCNKCLQDVRKGLRDHYAE